MNRIEFTNSIQGCSVEEIFNKYFARVMFLYNILDGSFNNVKIEKSSHDSFIVLFENNSDAEIVYRIMNKNHSITIYGITFTFESTMNDNILDISFIQI